MNGYKCMALGEKCLNCVCSLTLNEMVDLDPVSKKNILAQKLPPLCDCLLSTRSYKVFISVCMCVCVSVYVKHLQT